MGPEVIQVGNSAMKISKLSLWAASAITLAAAPALAREVYDDAYFVRPQGTGASMLQDRNGCRREAQGLGSGSASYSNPQYGALNAMGSALDEDALHEGGLHKRLERAVFNDCMKRLGWTALDPSADEARNISKASLRHTEPLDAWLKAHEPAAAPAASAAPAAAVAKP
jgi:hypothetical protein